MFIITVLLTALHVTVCFILIAVVLLQTGKGADLAGAFGGGGSQTALGPRSASNVLSKMTTASAIIFMISSLSLSVTKSSKFRGGGEFPEKGTPVNEQPAAAVPQPDTDSGEATTAPPAAEPGTAPVGAAADGALPTGEVPSGAAPSGAAPGTDDPTLEDPPPSGQ